MLEALDLDHVSMSDKFLMMEELWSSISKNNTASELTPQWHLDILKDREALVKSGEATFSSLADVKERLSKRNYAN